MLLKSPPAPLYERGEINEVFVQALISLNFKLIRNFVGFSNRRNYTVLPFKQELCQNRAEDLFNGSEIQQPVEIKSFLSGHF